MATKNGVIPFKRYDNYNNTNTKGGAIHEYLNNQAAEQNDLNQNGGRRYKGGATITVPSFDTSGPATGPASGGATAQSKNNNATLIGGIAQAGNDDAVLSPAEVAKQTGGRRQKGYKKRRTRRQRPKRRTRRQRPKRRTRRAGQIPHTKKRKYMKWKNWRISYLF